MSRSRDYSPTLSEYDHSDNDISVMSFDLLSTIQDFKIFQCRDITSLDPKNGRVQYVKDQKSAKNGNSERS